MRMVKNDRDVFTYVLCSLSYSERVHAAVNIQTLDQHVGKKRSSFVIECLLDLIWQRDIFLNIRAPLKVKTLVRVSMLNIVSLLKTKAKQDQGFLEFVDAFDTKTGQIQLKKPEKGDYMYIPLLCFFIACSYH